MKKEAYYSTVKDLQEAGRDNIPDQFRSNTHEELFRRSKQIRQKNKSKSKGDQMEKAMIEKLIDS